MISRDNQDNRAKDAKKAGSFAELGAWWVQNIRPRWLRITIIGLISSVLVIALIWNQLTDTYRDKIIGGFLDGISGTPNSWHAVSLPQPNKKHPYLERLRRGEIQNQERRVFRVTLANPMQKQILIDKWRSRWNYYRGFLSSIARAEIIEPTGEYTIIINIDPGDISVRQKEISIEPTLVLRSATENDPSLYEFDLEIIYEFDNKSGKHANSDWNIKVDVDILTTAGEEIHVIENMWWNN